VKIRILASIALALAVLAAAALWDLGTLPPRARPESPLERAAAAGSPREPRREVLTYAMTTGNRQVIEALLQKAPDLRLTVKRAEAAR